MTATNPKALFTFAAVEAAMCMWESCLHLLNPQPAEKRNRTAEVRRIVALIDEASDGAGQYEMRHMFMRLGADCDRIWNELSEDERDEVQFDWDFCPAFVLGAIDWETDVSVDKIELHPDALDRVRRFMKPA